MSRLSGTDFSVGFLIYSSILCFYVWDLAFLSENMFLMNLLSGASVSVRSLMFSLGFSLRVRMWMGGSYLNDSPSWGRSFCWASVFWLGC